MIDDLSLADSPPTPAAISRRRTWFWLALGAGFLIFVTLIHSVLLPFVLGTFTAYFLDPAADRLEEWGFSRGIATLTITCVFFSVLALLILLIAPIIVSQLSGLVQAIPEYIREFQHRYQPLLRRQLNALPVEDVKNSMADASGFVLSMVGGFFTGVLHSGMVIVNLLSLILVTPIVAFYMLRDWDRMIERIYSLLPRSHAHIVREQALIVDRTLAGFIRGQLTVCLLLGTYYAIGLSLLGLKFGILIGLGSGFLALLPYVGLMFGGAVGLAVAFFQFENLSDVGLVLGVFVTGQIVEGYFLTPKMVGERVGLHPVWVIFGMLAGGALFGFVGVLLAVPVSAVIGVLIRFALQNYLASGFYRGEQPIVLPD